MSQLYRKPLWIGTNVKLVKSEVQSDSESDSDSDSESEDYINATLTDVYYASVQLFNPTGGMESQSTIHLPMFVFTINSHSTFNSHYTFNVPYSRLGDLIKDSRTYDIPNITYVPRYSVDSVVCLSTEDLNTHKYTVVSIHFGKSFKPTMVGPSAESNIRYKLKGPLSEPNEEQTIITRTGQEITMLSTNPLAQPEQGGGKRRNKKRTRKSRKRSKKRSRKRSKKSTKRTRKRK